MFPEKIRISNKLIGHLAFLILAFLAVFFYLERTIFVDPAYAAFNLLYYKDFVVEAGRYAAVLPQALPLVAISLHLPLKVVLGIYSLSFILLYYLIFLIIAYGFKNDSFALAVPLVILLGVKYSFFWISTETHQALVYSILFSAFLFYSVRFRPGYSNNLIKLVLASGIILLCFYTHPVSFFLVLFILGYFVIDRDLWRDPTIYLMAILVVAITIIKVLTASSSGYEGYFFSGFFSFFEKAGRILDSESLIFLYSKMFNIYLFSWIIFIITILFYIINKKYLKLTYYVISILLFLVIVFTTYDVWYLPFIEEKDIMPLNVFLLVPLMNEVVFSSTRLNIYKQLLVILIFLVAVGHVVSASFSYKDRLSYIRELISRTRQFPEKKFIMGEKCIDRNRIKVPWALGPETLLLSSLESPDSSRSIFFLEDHAKLSPWVKLNDSLLFICTQWAQDLEIRRMDKRYFNLDHSSFRVLSEQDMHGGYWKLLYESDFDKHSKKDNNINRDVDSIGNSFYLLKDEYSPGFYGKYVDVTNKSSTYLSAKVKVFPLEEVDFKSLNLVISREQGNKIFDYYMSGVTQPTELKAFQWNTLTVTGEIRSTDKKDEVKVYVWNPGKKKIRINNLVIHYKTD